MRTTWFRTRRWSLTGQTKLIHSSLLKAGCRYSPVAMAETTRILPFNGEAIAEAARMIAWAFGRLRDELGMAYLRDKKLGQEAGAVLPIR
jgi:hypothetical protein